MVSRLGTSCTPDPELRASRRSRNLFQQTTLLISSVIFIEQNCGPDSLHSHNSNPRKKASPHAAPSSRSAAARHDNGLRAGRHRSLLARMPKPNAKKRRVNRVKGSAPRGHARVKGFASRGRGKKWILLLLVVLLLIPAMQVAVVRFINPPWTLPMLIDQASAMFSSRPKPPLRYRWIA